MNILRLIPIAIALSSAMVTVASCQTPDTGVTIQEATPNQIVLLVKWGNKSLAERLVEIERLADEHCKKFDSVAGKPFLSMNMGAPSGVVTFQCVGTN